MTNPIKLPMSVVFILNSDAQVLLLQQRDNRWTLPHCELHSNETPVVAVERLTKELTSLTLDELECIGFSSAHNEVQNIILQEKQNAHPHSFIFSSTAWQGEPQTIEPYQTLEFFSLTNLPTLAKPIAHYIDVFYQWLPERGFLFV